VPRKAAIAVLATALLLLPTGCAGSGKAAQGGTLVLAASLELTGTASDVGLAHQRALKLKVEQVNASGGLRGRKIRLVIADNQTDSAVTQQQVSKWANDPEVAAIIVGGCSACASDSANIVNAKGIPMISLAAANAVTTPVESRRFVFKIGPNVPDDARALVAELVRAKTTTIGLLGTDDAYGADGRSVMGTEAGKASISVSGIGKFQSSGADLAAAARGAMAGKPEAIVVWALPGQAASAASALWDAGYRGRLYFDAAAAGNLFLGTTARVTDGASMIFTQTFAMDDVIATTPAKAAQRKWFEDYTSRYGSYQGQSSFGADAVQLVVDAANQSMGTDRESLRTALETIQADGLSGPIRLTPANHSGLMPQALTVLVARGGRWRLLG
jgi:branched-chain amino acid transport system substrate-binding protein